jgi:transcriptional regulator with XRE-family HTH domain
MKTLSERITYALARSGKKQADLVRATGAKASSVTNWIGGRTSNLKGDNLTNAANLLGVNPAWLASGTGSIDQTDDSWPFENIERSRFNALTDRQKGMIEDRILLALAEIEAASPKPKTA